MTIYDETLGVNLTTLLIFICVMLVLLIAMGIGERKKMDKLGKFKQLPGPPALPIVGNIFDMDIADQQKSMQTLVEKYGNIFKIWIFRTPVVVLNGYDVITQALKHQSIDFAGRPHFHTFQMMHKLGSGFLAFGDYDETWKLHRKIGETALKSFVTGRNIDDLELRITNELTELIAVLTDNNNCDGKIIEPSVMIKLSVCNIMFSYMFGRRRTYSDSKLHDFLSTSHKFGAAAGNGNPVDFLPWLRHFPNKTMRDFKDIILSLKHILSDDIKRHEERHVQGVTNDMCDHMLDVFKSMDQSEIARLNIDQERIMSTVYDIFGAGFDTISASLIWALLLLIAHPEVQTGVHEEMDRVIGDKPPSFKDKQNMPYTEACILETLRYVTVVPFSIPHKVTRDTTLNEFYIEKDTTVFVNLHSVHHDKTRWVNPESFNPSRFLTEDGLLNRQKVDQMMSFSAGRRRCLGSELARIELFLFFATLLHQCQFECVNGSKPSLEPIHGLTVRPKLFKMMIRPRYPANSPAHNI